MSVRKSANPVLQPPDSLTGMNRVRLPRTFCFFCPAGLQALLRVRGVSSVLTLVTVPETSRLQKPLATVYQSRFIPFGVMC